MTSLRELQQRAYRAIVHDAGAPPGASARLARLDVYRNNARETFRKTLAATYPVVLRLVGDDCFRGLASQFMRDFPSRAGDLGRFGAELPLALDVRYRGTEFAYLADVARLEWACAEVETASHAMPFDLLDLGSVRAEECGALRFTMRPAVRFVSSRYPVLAIWRANQTDDVTPVDLDAGGERVLVVRSRARLTLHALDAGTFAFGRSLADGETLADACDAGVGTDPAFDVRTALVSLARLDVLAGFRFASNGLD